MRERPMTSSRDKRAARHQVQAMKRGDKSFDEVFVEVLIRGEDDSPLTLKDGSSLDLNQPWEVPQQQEK